MASRAEEGRGKSAISLGELSSKPSRGFPNGATRLSKRKTPPAEHIGWEGGTRGSETSQYPEERKIYSLSSGERKGKSPNLISSVVLEPKLIRGCKTGRTQFRMGQEVTNRTLIEGAWKGQPKRVTGP